MDECSFCHQQGHWKNACPKLAHLKGRSSSQCPSQPHFQSFSHPPAALATSTSSNSVSYPTLQSMLEQFQSMLASSSMTRSPGLALTTTNLDLHGSYPIGTSFDTWIFDSGCSHHMTSNLSILSHYISSSSPITILLRMALL